MSDIVIYHNPRCSKSRQTLALLEQQGIHPEIVLYLETPPTEEILETLVSQLGFSSPRELMRKGEAEYKEQQLANPELTAKQLLSAMVQSPKLIERPIVVANQRAAIGRPPEAVLEILA